MKKGLFCLSNIIVNTIPAFLISGLLIAALQYALSGGERPENITWTGVYVLGGFLSLMYASAGIIIASISTAVLIDSAAGNLLRSLITGLGGGLIFVASLIVIPVRHEKLQVLLAAVACLVASLLYLDYLLKSRKSPLEQVLTGQAEEPAQKQHKKNSRIIESVKEKTVTPDNSSSLRGADEEGIPKDSRQTALPAARRNPGASREGGGGDI